MAKQVEPRIQTTVNDATETVMIDDPVKAAEHLKRCGIEPQAKALETPPVDESAAAEKSAGEKKGGK